MSETILNNLSCAHAQLSLSCTHAQVGLSRIPTTEMQLLISADTATVQVAGLVAARASIRLQQHYYKP